jgi:hypothetical protein
MPGAIELSSSRTRTLGGVLTAGATWAGAGPPERRAARRARSGSGGVTRRTSSRVVRPARALARPSARMLRMTPATASSLTATSLARSTISSRILRVTRTTSNRPTRPWYRSGHRSRSPGPSAARPRRPGRGRGRAAPGSWGRPRPAPSTSRRAPGPGAGDDQGERGDDQERLDPHVDEPVDRLLHVGGGGHRGAHRGQLGGQADVVKGEHVGRVGQGDREHVVGQGHRDRAVAQGDVAGEHGQRLVQLRLGEDLPGDQDLAEPATPTRAPASGPARALSAVLPSRGWSSSRFYRQPAAPR